ERDNVLAVLATEHSVASDQLDKMSEYADMDLGGIFRSVRLSSVPALHLGGLALVTSWEHGRATVSGTVSVLDCSAVSMPAVELRLGLREPGGAEVAGAVLPAAVAAWSRCDVPVSLTVPQAKGWNAEQPFLYELSIELRAASQTVQTVNQRFGLRQTAVRGSELLVNGRPIKLRGTCHHDSDPLRGRAVTAALQRQDVEQMREANLNALRTSHYPPHEALLFAADELGLYVEDEASFCWTSATDDLRVLPRVVQLVAEMVARDRNHASVTLWSLCNESRVGQGLWRAREVLRRLDPSRPVAGSWAPDGSLDFAVRHNPITTAGIDDVEHAVTVPVLWDESWCIWQDIWGDAGELWLDPGLRDAYIAPLPAIYERFAHSQVVQGTMIWAWSDDIFLLPGAGLEYGRGSSRERFVHEQYSMPGRGVVGDAQWGVVDAWRRRKPEFLHTKKLHSPVRIAEAPLPLPPDRTLHVPVENRYDFLDLSGLRFHWQLGEAEGTVRADVPPRGRGTLAIELPRRPRNGERLRVQVADEAGRGIDEVVLAIGEPPQPPAEERASGPALSLHTEQRLNGTTTYVTGEHFELGIGEQLGDLRRGVGFGRQLLRSLPVLHVLATGRPQAPLPSGRTWRLTRCEVQRDGDDAKVVVQGRYDGFEGGYVYRIGRDARIDVQATFVHTGELVQVREVGLSFTVPRAADALQWTRRAEWGVYPPDHIGRPSGRARAFPVHGEVLPPAWPWAEDNTPLGCNDFRSSKRSIERGWIGLPDGPGVRIESNGSQNLRATVAGDHIEVVVTDELGGSNGLGEWTSNYGTGRPLGVGEVVTAHVVLRWVATAPPIVQ
ncbi:MAG TPA: glycoside hydrolase family 2 TIM barrel-domain containing protein, partial [Planctomycetota bacterium]|nr:glycoside hydrolase family 2 TIM barrel-domain containing protein [Planctomycetota bacterium]